MLQRKRIRYPGHRYPGFSKDNETDQSQRDTKWDNDYLHFTELIKKGTISDISDNWFTSGGQL